MELLLANDCALLAFIEEALQCTGDCFQEVVKAFGLIIILKKKTKAMYQLPPNDRKSPPQISISDITPNTMKNCTYLDSIISKVATVNKDPGSHLIKGNSSLWLPVEKGLEESPALMHNKATDLMSKCHPYTLI